MAVASVRVLQWVAPRGVVSHVRVTTASTGVSLIVRGAPGRGSSSRPSPPLSINRCRQRPTVGFDIRSFFTTVVLSSLVAHASTIRARRASWGAVRARCAIESSTCRSTFVTTNAALGQAIVHLLSPCTTGGGLLFTYLQGHDTRLPVHSTDIQSSPSKPIWRSLSADLPGDFRAI